MRHRIGSLIHRLADWIDHSHCPYCGTEDGVCCIGTPRPDRDGACGTCSNRAGWCWLCSGSGSEIHNVEMDGTILVIPCRGCDGTGRA